MCSVCEEMCVLKSLYCITNTFGLWLFRIKSILILRSTPSTLGNSNFLYRNDVGCPSCSGPRALILRGTSGRRVLSRHLKALWIRVRYGNNPHCTYFSGITSRGADTHQLVPLLEAKVDVSNQEIDNKRRQIARLEGDHAKALDDQTQAARKPLHHTCRVARATFE